MRIPHISPKNASGLFDKVLGLGREVAGTLFDNGSVKKAGQIQQEKGTEKLKAVESELDAQRYDAQAKAAQTKEKTTQKSKVNA